MRIKYVIALSIMVNGIAYSSVVQNVSKLTSPFSVKADCVSGAGSA